MSKNQPSQGTTSVSAVALIEKVLSLATSRDPHQRAAGWLILAGCFIAYAAAGDGAPML